MRPENSWMSLVPSSWRGLRWQKVKRTVHQPYPHRDWRKIRQDCRTGSLALAVAERCDHHPEDCSQGTNAGESESLRLRT